MNKLQLGTKLYQEVQLQTNTLKYEREVVAISPKGNVLTLKRTDRNEIEKYRNFEITEKGITIYTDKNKTSVLLTLTFTSEDNELSEVEQHVFKEISKLGTVYKTERRDCGFTMTLELNESMTENDKDKMSDDVYDIEKWLEDKQTDTTEYQLHWGSNWYGEDMFILETIEDEE